MRIGTSDNPIKLVSESTPRSLLLKHSRSTSLDEFDFHKLPDSEDDAYINNIIFNNHLTLQEVKLAVYFHERLAYNGAVFSTSNSEKFCPMKEYGDIDIGGLVIGSDGSFDQDIVDADEYGEFPSLLNLTTAMGMQLTPQGITNLVRRLHDFGYITVTDITPINTFTPKKPSLKQTYRARLRHIRLCEGMRRKDISSRWISRKKKKRQPKRKDANVT